MLSRLIIFSFALSANTLSAQVSIRAGEKAADFVPPKYKIDAQLEGDMNGDSFPDLILILRAPVSAQKIAGSTSTEDLSDRWVVILEGTHDRFYRLAAQNNTMALCPECGGIRGDPLQPMQIANRVLTISNYGGSNWRWGFQYKIAYYHGQYQLIGYTSLSARPQGCSETLIDYNTVTGKAKLQKQTAKNDQCVPVEQWVNIRATTPFHLDAKWKLPSETEFPNFFPK